METQKDPWQEADERSMHHLCGFRGAEDTNERGDAVTKNEREPKEKWNAETKQLLLHRRAQRWCHVVACAVQGKVPPMATLIPYLEMD
ncbi:hypothetical protein CHS0354_010806 [Potamilus streckersoni]|uniref:Uncharacterized protein n=1 Tax=Potamilus streckersoni TaxID=2493646 RepID=A0AAE0T984_9BIVA|nr:hypothetical protein CHS0354_010806 [Potamilus streckersoni]